MKLKKLIIIAPNDRYNYGDLLFSHIIKFQLAHLYDKVVNVATVEGDLTNVGGDIVKPLSTIYTLSDEFENHIIIAGGESFFSQWYHTISYLSPAFRSKSELIIRILNKLKLESLYFFYAKCYAKLYLKATTEFPYSIGKSEVKNVERIFYNSLGASGLKRNFLKRKSVIDVLKNVDYISLRDKNSNDILSNAGFKSYLVPDCAIVMSEYYTKDFLLDKIASSVSNFAEKNINEYIVFQINRKLGEKYFDDIISFLSNLNDKRNLKVCLCPVGFALGHEDHIVLRNVHNKLSELGITPFFLEELKIWDIMFLIGHSKLYIGTSLHGAITAMSYKRPYIGIMTRKTIDYINTWGINQRQMTASSFDILPQVDSIINDDSIQRDLEQNYLFQKKKVFESFESMKESI